MSLLTEGCRARSVFRVSEGLFIRNGRAGEWREPGREQGAETSCVSDSVIR